jgi:hypothetical protein
MGRVCVTVATQTPQRTLEMQHDKRRITWDDPDGECCLLSGARLRKQGAASRAILDIVSFVCCTEAASEWQTIYMARERLHKRGHAAALRAVRAIKFFG